MIKRLLYFVLAITVITTLIASPTTFAMQSNNIMWNTIYNKQNLNSAAYGNGTYVAVGNSGSIKVSQNGEAWTNINANTNAGLNAVVYGNSRFVAVGNGILTSINGRAWKEAETPISGQLFAVAYNGTLFVAVGEAGRIYTSTDGLTWNAENSDVFEGANLTQLAINGDKFVTMSENSDKLFVSDNGKDWQAVKPDADYSGFSKLASNGSKFFVYASTFQEHTSGYSVSAYFLSDDGINWTKYLSPPIIQSITTDGSHFIGIGGYPVTNISISEDGINWQAKPTENYMFYTGAKLFALNGRYYSLESDGVISVSTNGIAWHGANTNAQNPFSSVLYENHSVKLPSSITDNYNKSSDTATNGQIYVRVGGKAPQFSGDGAFDTMNRSISTSTDGSNWNTKTEEGLPPLNKIAFGNGTFVAVGNSGAILTSTDGNEWTSQAVDGLYGDILDIIYDGSQFIATGQGEILTSTDGINWSKQDIGDTIYQLLWNDNEYIGVGMKSIICAARPMTFTDMQNHWAKDYVSGMYAKSIIKGVGNNNFEPDRAITRAEYAAIIVRALGLTNSGQGIPFADVNSNDWYYSSIAAAYESGILGGYGENIAAPNQSITRQEAMAMTARALKLMKENTEVSQDEISSSLSNFNDNQSVGNWAKASVAVCISSGIVEGNAGMLNPTSSITRAETATIVSRMMSKLGI